MTVPDRAVRPPHPFRLEPWSSGARPVAGGGAAASTSGTTQDVPQVMGFLHDLDAATYELRQRVLDAGLRKQPVHLIRVATWVRGRMRACRRLLAPAAGLR